MRLDHLTDHRLSLGAGEEWPQPEGGWLCLRLAAGQGYWLQNSGPLELGENTVLVASHDVRGVFRASRLGDTELQYFQICPHTLQWVLTPVEQRGLEQILAAGGLTRLFSADCGVAAAAHRLWSKDATSRLHQRSRMLELFAMALAPELGSPPADVPGTVADARQRLRRWLAQTAEIELLNRSIEELARELNCSLRHFSRLFHEEVGMSFRDKQTELRLLKARQLLTGSDTKIIQVALESGYRHLGLFNALFKRRFGMTPTRWRLESTKPAPRRRRIALPAATRLALAALAIAFLPAVALSQAPATTNVPAGSTNAPAGPVFSVHHYEVQGNTLLPEEAIAAAVGEYTGEAVNFETIRQALASLQLAYRGRGWATVSVGLPQQQITNGIVRVKVTEGQLVDIQIVGNRWFSTNNVSRALPGLHTNTMLNSKVFQAELDLANANRDRQIYPQIGPGPEPGTSSLILKVKDQLPLHGRFEFNNQATPGTPDLRGNSSVQYNNLWQREHSVGLQYGFAMQKFKEGVPAYRFWDVPSIANYSLYYRMPFGPHQAVSEAIDANPGRFGYDEVTRQFRLPPSTGRGELNFYGSRSTTDTGVNETPRRQINPPPIALYAWESGQDLSTTETLGFRWSQPLPERAGIRSTVSAGVDFKNYRNVSYNTNNFLEDFTFTDPSTGLEVHRTIPFDSAQPVRRASVSYLPVAVRWDASRPDSRGSTSFGLGVNFNVSGGPFSDDAEFRKAIPQPAAPGSRAGGGDYVTVQLSATREHRLYEEWTVLLKADGQWASTPLFSNEQYGMGGTAGVRGYLEGERYGDTGWRVAVEPRTPLIEVGMVDGTEPMRMRFSTFVDYGQSYLLDPRGRGDRDQQLWGTGVALSGSISTVMDFRLTLSWALLDNAFTRTGELNIYFGIGAQF
jgi:hemolysin activation/secretion protein/AraC-like DNA-binding protein